MKNALRKSYILLLLLCATASIAFASHVKGDDEINITSTITENAYLAGGSVTISAPIQGDLFCMGGQIVVSDTIQDDAMIAGGQVDVRGVILGDLRIASGDVSISNRIGGDLIVAGGQVELAEGVVIGGDLIVMGGDIIVRGTIEGQVQVNGGNLIFDGIAEGDASLQCGNIELNGEIRGDAVLAAEHIELGLNPALHGKVEYWTRDGEMDFGSTLKSNAELIYSPNLARSSNNNFNEGSRFFSAGFWIWRILSASIVMLLLYLLFKRFFNKVGRNIMDNTLNKGLLGFGYFIAVPVLIFALFITVIGIPAGLFVLSFYVFTLAFAKSLAAVVGAFALNHYFNQDWSGILILLVALGLYIGLSAVGMLPMVGSLLVAIAVAVAFGAVILQFQRRRKEQELV